LILPNQAVWIYAQTALFLVSVGWLSFLSDRDILSLFQIAVVIAKKYKIVDEFFCS
jgi:hypothetical protein